MEIGYNITDYTYAQAKKLGVEVRLSKNKKKKIDVYKNGELVASVGQKGMDDYHSHMRKRGKDYADKRRKAYKSRHESNRHKKGSPGYYADQLLW